MQRSKLTIVASMLILICSNVVFGYDPMGPPRALLKPGQPSLGVDYIYSKMEIKMVGAFGESDVDVKDMELNKIYLNLGYGLADGWDVFGRLGVAVLDIDQGANRDNFTSLIGRSDGSLAIGIGTRVTCFEWDELSIGMLAQVSFVPFENFEGSPGILFGSVPATIDAEINMTEVQIAVGPTWNCTDYLSIYGGPFIHIIDGRADLVATNGSSIANSVGIEQSTIFGGYIGATVLFYENPNISCNVESMATEAGHALAIQLAISP